MARNGWDSIVISKDTVVAMLHWQTKCAGSPETWSGNAEHTIQHFISWRKPPLQREEIDITMKLAGLKSGVREPGEKVLTQLVEKLCK